MTTNRDNALLVLEGMTYLETLLNWHDSIPQDRIAAFCERQKAPIGANRLYFLITRAEELEAQVAEAAKSKATEVEGEIAAEKGFYGKD